MKAIVNNILGLLVITLFLGCDDYLDVNVDPNKEGLDTLIPADLLTTSIFYTSSAHYNVAVGVCQYSQQLASYFEPGTDTQEEIQLTDAWRAIYLEALADIATLADVAERESATSYLGISKILKATNIGLATDQWGDVPVTTATLGEENFKPSFDAQEAVYTEINTLLDDAIILLGQTDSSGFTIGEDDIIYGGDTAKWIKTAYFLKAKYAIHLTEVDQNAAIAGVLANIENAFTSNDDDFQLIYNSRNFNLWNSEVVLPNNTGNFSVLLSDQLVSLMDGTSFPFSSIELDPRLPEITTIGEDDTEFLGAINGTGGFNVFVEAGSDSNIGANTNLGADNFYSSQSAPIILGSYSELKFIEAEALFLQDGGTPTSIGATQQAYDAYLEGINANMTKLGIPTGEASAYLSDVSVAVGAENLTMALIMREKFIATFLNPESFVDLRRYDFDPNVFVGLELPFGHNPILNGEWVRRVQYPASEQTRNGDQVEIVVKEISEGVWWDRD
ncbi:SusD/RagB family nutrient-binding outer membrane lipoprotein [Flagellimonas sp. HMM57]|uniref:SusD/RagB family nutrient-binding outer membrane lipoprotein n=1 Tax=unclassified Flagellimonas TaxID=2644544 RepID=UPI0013D8C52D|nr:MULTISPECIES: SusD/RagB family nutrient-binding outer membrane lipoprotein [unclassified Flagellimonas]UII75408.1 SusD/RagB family nutrient-binding outer membrane lipoprotein [Flagellimonas sp. HMM57]